MLSLPFQIQMGRRKHCKTYVIETPEFASEYLLVVNPSFKFFFFYLFLDRVEGREKKRERSINVWLPLACPLLRT